MTKNKFGVASIGSYGVSSQGTIGGYEVEGFIQIDLHNGKWTSIYYFNNPSMHIPYNGGYYVHDEMPAYMVKRKNSWFVGTKDQITQWYLSLRAND